MASLTNANSCSPSLTFDPADAGKTFRVTQTVTDPGGLSDSTSQTIAVAAGCADTELIIPVTSSYISNADFNEAIPSPADPSVMRLPDGDSQLDRAVGWAQFSEGTSDYFYDGAYSGESAPFTSPSPDGGGYAGFIFNYVVPPNINYWEYISQILATPLQTGITYLASFYAGGGSIDPTRNNASGNRDVVLYGMPLAQSNVAGRGHISTLGVDAVELGRATMTVTGNDWEILTIEFTPSQEIRTVAFGGETSDPDRKYACIDRLLLNEKSVFTCP